MAFLTQLKDYFGRLSAGQKTITVFIFVAVFSAVAFLSFFLKYEGYSTLYASLSPEDANQIVEQLRNDKVPYRLSDSGRTIKVPTAQLYDLRIKLSSAGLPRGGMSGFELFDKNNMGMTDFMQQVNYQRAIQGELSRTISELEAVQQAKVHITFPDSSSFLEEEQKTSASVVLTLKPGAVLDQKQIRGIVSMVAGSVKGLKPENVTLIDAYGNLLSKKGDEDSSLAGADTSMEMRRSVEAYLENKALSLLEKVIGPGKAVVRVTADLNNHHVKEQTETYNPTGVIRSEQTSKDASAVTLKNYEVGKTVREVVETGGSVQKLNVSVVLDGIVTPDPNDPKKTISTPRSDAELATYLQLVSQAIGFNEERGDQIEIKSVPFDHEYKNNVDKQMEEQAANVKKMRTQEEITSLVGKGLVCLSMIALVIILLKATKKSMVEQKTLFEATGTPALAMANAGMQALPEPRGIPPARVETGGQEEAAEAQEAPAVAEKKAARSAMPELDIVRVAKENPEEVARVMRRTWIKK